MNFVLEIEAEVEMSFLVDGKEVSEDVATVIMKRLQKGDYLFGLSSQTVSTLEGTKVCDVELNVVASDYGFYTEPE